MTGSLVTPAAEPRKTFGYKLALFMWIILLLDPQVYVAYELNLDVAMKLPQVLMWLMLLLVLTRLPKRVFLPPFAAITGFLLLVLPHALNADFALVPTKLGVIYYVLALGLVTFVKTPRQALPFVYAFMVGEFIWWGFWGVRNGGVEWHYQWANYDGYGPLMALGIASAFPLAVAAKKSRTRSIAFAVGVLCVLALVSSFARGAFLSMIAVLGWLWLNAPRKGAATGFLVVAGIALFLATKLFVGTDRGGDTKADFFEEMATMFDPEETTTGTGGDREVLWGAAVQAFKAHPIIGTGGGSFGVFAAEYYTTGGGTIGGEYANNPRKLYDRKLHNIFFQILSEYGFVGTVLYLWLFVDFFRRNQRLRSPAFGAAWASRGAGELDLKWIAVGLSAMMIASMANGMFYNLLEMGFIPTIVIMNGLLYKLAEPVRASQQLAPSAGQRRGSLVFKR